MKETKNYRPSEILKSNKIIIKFCNKISVFSFELIHSITQFNKNQLIILLYFIKIYRSFKSVIYLYKQGYSPQAQVITRTIFEAFIYLRKLNEDKSFLEKIIQKSVIERLKKINYLANNDNSLLDTDIVDEVKSININERLKEVDLKSIDISKDIYKQLDKFEVIKKTTLYKLAGELNMINQYESTYWLLSNNAHPDFKTLTTDLLTIDADDLIIRLGPSYDEIKLTLIFCIDMLIDSIQIINQNFSLNIDNKIESLINEKINLSKLSNL